MEAAAGGRLEARQPVEDLQDCTSAGAGVSRGLLVGLVLDVLPVDPVDVGRLHVHADSTAHGPVEGASHLTMDDHTRGGDYSRNEAHLHLDLDGENDVVLHSDSVSRRHARVETRSGGYVVVDMHSTNGTYVNDELVDERELRRGDQIKIGAQRHDTLPNTLGDACILQEPITRR